MLETRVKVAQQDNEAINEVMEMLTEDEHDDQEREDILKIVELIATVTVVRWGEILTELTMIRALLAKDMGFEL